jgi:hypothetical protein
MSMIVALRVWPAVVIILSLAAGKWASLRAARTRAIEPLFVWAPVFSLATWRKRRPRDRTLLRSKLIELAVFATLAVATFWLYWRFVPPLRPSTWAQGYWAIVPFYLLVEAVAALFEALFTLTGWHLPAHMRRPPLATSIAAFWGERWGTWVSDWMRQVIVGRYRRRPLLAVTAVFLVSGVWHELLIDVPAAVFYGVPVLGMWLLYFVIQGVGLIVERALLRKRAPLRVIFAWSVILLPAPLALNQATLIAAGLWVG